MQKRQRMQHKKQDVLDRWTIQKAVDFYGIHRWGKGIFSANAEGHVCLSAHNGTAEVDLKALVEEIRRRGMRLPVLFRFTDILRQRIRQIHEAFKKACKENKYTGKYQGVYPIKVNQHRHIVEDIVETGREFGFGLEAGSKPELLIAIAHYNRGSMIVCNGFKDRDYIETALAARQMGYKIFLVVEKPGELPLILDVAKKMKVDPLLGIRLKLTSRGKGMWESSGGDRSKFGLFASEVIDAIKFLKKRRMLKQLQLLHFHIGSQITDIQFVKAALREATTIFTEVSRLGAPIDYLDVGGGLAVDYDGSHTNFASSANYDVTEYAADVVYHLSMACEETDIPHPNIITECGRALTAYHSVLVVEAMEMSTHRADFDPPKVTKRSPELLQRIRDVYEDFSPKRFQEAYHDAVEARREALMLFNLRHLSLEDRGKIERYFWLICAKVYDYATGLDYRPDELDGLKRLLATTYYCNFSLFQSLPDHWALNQLFPITPLQRLDEKPTVESVLADITCDSDGIIDTFIDLRDVSDTLALHPLRKNENYDLGIFLVGAYQEILGDLHNLFGDTTVVHVSSGPEGYVIDKTVEGDSVQDVLGYVQFTRRDFLQRIREQIEIALRNKEIALEDSAAFLRRIEKGLDAYTYLEK